MGTFRAILLEEKDGKVAASLTALDEARLPAGDATVRVTHSTLNYKDGLVLNGLGRLVRIYPHVPGVDFAGIVEHSDSPRVSPGDATILTGWRVGEWHWGGYAEKARVKADWLVKLPAGLTAARAMAIGTAGLTAMLALQALERDGLAPEMGEVLVTGATGGLGSVAVAILARNGYRVVAGTGKADSHDYLKSLGAAAILPRAELAGPSSKPLQSERWAAVVDTVGGTTLANALAQLKHGRALAACGNAGGNEIATTVLPFLLRGVRILGIDSVVKPIVEREAAWARLVRDLPMDKLDAMTETVGLADVPELGRRILKGQVRGRVVVDMSR